MRLYVWHPVIFGGRSAPDRAVGSSPHYRRSPRRWSANRPKSDHQKWPRAHFGIFQNDNNASVFLEIATTGTCTICKSCEAFCCVSRPCPMNSAVSLSNNSGFAGGLQAQDVVDRFDDHQQIAPQPVHVTLGEILVVF